jgi:hypothetical protein
MTAHDEEQAVLAVLQALFDAIANQDQAAMHAVLVPEGGATHSRDDRVFHTLLRDLPARLPVGATALEERIFDPLIRVDDDIAMIWAPYDFFVDGEPHHWGTNIISLIKRDGRWRITGVTDNGRSGRRPTSRPTT